ncbi:TPA: fimbrial protein [Klebsiella oxytoca]|uniref:Fimbrial protein n=1 Tax=Klebsiella oxytoca TaxID=571 RepID=A0AAN5RH18_KLEOX|nr:fimbrial protein [Klebsiella oxytoca]
MMKISFCCPRLQGWLSLLCLSLLALLTAPARADSYCMNKGDSVIPIPTEIMVTPQSGGGPLYESPMINFQYQCFLDSKDSSQSKSLQFALSNYGELRQQLDKAGLEVYIVVPNPFGGGENSFNILDGIQNFTSFGSIGSGATQHGRFDFRLRVVKKSAFSGAVKIYFPEKKPFITLNISGVTNTQQATIGFDGFNLQIIPTCFGQVDTPIFVDLGRVYTFQSQPDFSKTVPFSITARRDTGCLLNGDNDQYDSFTLKSTFTTQNALTDGNKAILLTAPDGSPNGLKLYIKDKKGDVTFGQPGDFGELTKPAGNNAAVTTKNYTAVLAATGQPLVTGDFSADVVVTITFQ